MTRPIFGNRTQTRTEAHKYDCYLSRLKLVIGERVFQRSVDHAKVHARCSQAHLLSLRGEGLLEDDCSLFPHDKVALQARNTCDIGFFISPIEQRSLEDICISA